MMYLNQIGENNILPQGVLCVSLAHNEFLILPEFLRHYRTLGVTSFAMVDDRSDDETRQFLLSQDDVTVFVPTDDSTYKSHCMMWRKDILDAYGIDRWCLNPDIDEHFVYRDMETKPLDNLIQELETENSEALLTIMIDMYADQPILEQRYQPRKDQNLLQRFPYFDSPRRLRNNYCVIPKKGGTPPVWVYGGFRMRLLNGNRNWWRSVQDRIFMQRNRSIRSAINFHSRQRHGSVPKPKDLMGAPILSKLGLLKWQRGMTFTSSTHAINMRVCCSERIAAFLHYHFAHSVDRFHYIVERGAHINNSSEYKNLLQAIGNSNRSPVCEVSARYANSRSLKGLVR